MDKPKKIATEYSERADDIISKRFVPSWLFAFFRFSKAAPSKFFTYSKILIGSLSLVVFFAIWSVILLALLPSRSTRIKACNYFGMAFGRFNFWLSGSRLKVIGKENLDRNRPAIYVSNHTSTLDLFFMMWKMPVGTCSISKKQILFYPLFGILFLLSGHLIIDRGNSKKAIASMKHLEGLVKKYNLSVIIWPEGTRSKDGKLRQFKKGFAHMAIQTGLPVVPCVVSNAYKGWQKNVTEIGKTLITMEVLEAFDTSHWTVDNIDESVEEIMQIFNNRLPKEQRRDTIVERQETEIITPSWPNSDKADSKKSTNQHSA